MITKKDLVVAVFVTFCLTASLFLLKFVRSQSEVTYDPWADINDDGKINMFDIGYVARRFGLGTPGDEINKTALLYNVNDTFTSLIAKIDSLNSSLSELRSQVDSLNVTNLMPIIDDLNSSLLTLQFQLNSLNTTVIQLQSSDASLGNSLSQLQSRVDTMNNTMSLQISTLQSQMAILNTAIVTMNATITQLQNSNADLSSRVSSLEGNFSSLLARVSALEGNYSVTNLKLAPFAIPFNMTYSTVHNFTTETAGFVDMPYTSVTLALNRTSQLLIMFSADAGISQATHSESCYIICEAVVNGVSATPSSIELTPTTSIELGNPYAHAHRIVKGTCSYNFYTNALSAGTYTVSIRWYISSAGTGDVYSRTLAVIALPA